MRIRFLHRSLRSTGSRMGQLGRPYPDTSTVRCLRSTAQVISGAMGSITFHEHAHPRWSATVFGSLGAHRPGNPRSGSQYERRGRASFHSATLLQCPDASRSRWPRSHGPRCQPSLKEVFEISTLPAFWLYCWLFERPRCRFFRESGTIAVTADFGMKYTSLFEIYTLLVARFIPFSEEAL